MTVKTQQFYYNLLLQGFLCFDCHLYVFIVISNTSRCLALNVIGMTALNFYLLQYFLWEYHFHL